MSGEGVIDEAALDGIRALQQPGAENILTRIIRLFVDDAERLRRSIGTAVDAGDTEVVAASAHSLKSSSASVGAIEVSAISEKLETAGRLGDLEAGRRLYDDLVAAVAAARSQLLGYLD